MVEDLSKCLKKKSRQRELPVAASIPHRTQTYSGSVPTVEFEKLGWRDSLIESQHFVYTHILKKNRQLELS